MNRKLNPCDRAVFHGGYSPANWVLRKVCCTGECYGTRSLRPCGCRASDESSWSLLLFKVYPYFLIRGYLFRFAGCLRHGSHTAIRPFSYGNRPLKRCCCWSGVTSLFGTRRHDFCSAFLSHVVSTTSVCLRAPGFSLFICRPVVSIWRGVMPFSYNRRVMNGTKPLSNMISNHFLYYPTPSNLNYS
jgi:hypothetical protein